MNAHAVVAGRVGTDVVARGQPVFQIGPKSAPASLDMCPVDHGRLESVHRFQSRGFRRETATESLLALRAGEGEGDYERPADGMATTFRASACARCNARPAAIPSASSERGPGSHRY